MVADRPDISIHESHDFSERLRKLLKIDHNGVMAFIDDSQGNGERMTQGVREIPSTIPHS